MVDEYMNEYYSKSHHITQPTTHQIPVRGEHNHPNSQ